MNAKELALQKNPMFFKVFMELQRYQSTDAVFEKFQSEWADHGELRNLIREIRKLLWDRHLWPAIGWSIPGLIIPLVGLVLLVLTEGSFLLIVLPLGFWAMAIPHYIKLSGLHQADNPRKTPTGASEPY